MKKLIVISLSLLLVLGIIYMAYKLDNRTVPQAPQAQTHATTQPPTTQPPTTAPATQPTYPKAPDFTVYDAEGNPVKLSDYLGKPVVLNFWASWCEPCKREMPEFEEVFLEMGDEVAFLMINVTTSEKSQEEPIALMKKLGYTFPVVYDLNKESSGPYNITAFPTTYFINAQGYAITRAVGAINKDTLLRGIGMIQ